MSELVEEPSDADFSRLMDERAPGRVKTTDQLPENDVSLDEPVSQQEDATESGVAEEELPEKYRGKSASEIARMHAEAETALGRQGQELGELRRLTAEIEELKSAYAAATQPRTPPPGAGGQEWLDEGMITRPTETIQYVEQNAPHLYDRAIEAWAQLDPFAAMRYDNRRALSEQQNVIRRELDSVRAPVAQNAQERQLAEAYATVVHSIPEYATVAEEIPGLIQNDPVLRNALAEGDVAQKSRILENLYYQVVGMRATRGEAQPETPNQSTEQQAKTAARAAKKAAAVVTGSSAGERGGQSPKEDFKSRILAAGQTTSVLEELNRSRAAAIAAGTRKPS